MDISQRLRDLRIEQEINQKVLADILHLKPGAISKYETGTAQPTLATVVKLAEIFKVSTDYLLGASDQKGLCHSLNFSSKEIDFLILFRKLSSDNQIRIDERMRTMVDMQNN